MFGLQISFKFIWDENTNKGQEFAGQQRKQIHQKGLKPIITNSLHQIVLRQCPAEQTVLRQSVSLFR